MRISDWSSDVCSSDLKRFAINLALTLAEQQFVLPIVTQLVGSAPGLFGITAPQGGAGAVNSVSSGGGILSSLSSLFTQGASGGGFLDKLFPAGSFSLFSSGGGAAAGAAGAGSAAADAFALR